FDLGNALKDKQDLEGARLAYRKGIELSPNHVTESTFPTFDRSVMTAHWRLVAAARQVTQLFPDDAAGHNFLGVVMRHPYAGRGRDPTGVLVAFHKAIELDPNHAAAHSNLGLVLWEANNLEGAIVGIRKAIELRPDLAPAHAILGRALRQKKDTDG